MLGFIYFIILLVFLLLRFFKDKSCGFSDKKSLLVTIMMAVLMGIEVFDAILYYYFHFDPFHQNLFYRLFFCLSYLIVPFFFSYAMVTYFHIKEKDSWEALFGFLIVANFVLYSFSTISLSSMYHKTNFQNGTVYFVGIIRDMDISDHSNKNSKISITFKCESVFGRKTVSRSFNGTIPEKRASYKSHPEYFEKYGYTVGESIIIKMALSDTTLIEFNGKNSMNISDNYSTPILKVGNNEYDYFSVTNPEKYGINIVRKNILDGDSVLVYKNLKHDTIFNLCANTLNTSVNFKKVTDYGYIFGDRIYPKEVVENQFPLVKQYVEAHYQPNR